MTDDFEARVVEAMAALRRDVILPAEADIWEWAEGVAISHLADECREDFEASGKTMRAWLAEDMAFRIGEQLVSMAGDVAPSEADYKDARRHLRVAPKIAERLQQHIGTQR
jgi:hypothetical protein